MSDRMKPSEIKVGNRAREGLGGLKKLENSIEKLGLLQRIGVTGNGELVYGFRRLEAWKNVMGDEPIPVEVVEPEDEKERRMMELAENVRRMSLSWQEKAELVTEIDRLGREIYGERPKGGRPEKNRSDSEQFWSTERTAEETGLSKGKVSDSLALARGMEENPELREIEDEFEALAEVHEEERGEPDTTACGVCGGEVPRTETTTIRVCKECKGAVGD